jgi:hypothetical protein
MTAIADQSLRVKARIAGVFYAITFVAGVFALVSANGRTAANLIATASYVAVTLLLYELFKGFQRTVSLAAAAFSLAGLMLAVLTMLHLTRIDISPLVFFGFYCVLIGYLIVTSRLLPRIVGWLMILGGLGWLTFASSWLTKLLYPYSLAPGMIGEGALTISLLAIGVNVPGWREPTRGNAGTVSAMTPSRTRS